MAQRLNANAVVTWVQTPQCVVTRLLLTALGTRQRADEGAVRTLRHNMRAE